MAAGKSNDDARVALPRQKHPMRTATPPKPQHALRRTSQGLTPDAGPLGWQHVTQCCWPPQRPILIGSDPTLDAHPTIADGEAATRNCARR